MIRTGPVLVVLLAACGGDIGDGEEAGGADAGDGAADGAAGPDAALGCGENGGGAVTSTTPGTEVEPVVSAWYQVVDADASALVIDERASNCEPDAITGQQGQLVLIYFCSALVVGDYDAVPTLAGACPDVRQASVTVVNEVLEDLVIDTTGSLAIEQLGDCITGSFATTTPGGEELSGSFRAYPCP
ncbi:MAG TPA: hypothetical protein VFU21_31700 [Kofleriaceae bacterium]|nr:hypothetical protein [Kofleriaceae bacterium]